MSDAIIHVVSEKVNGETNMLRAFRDEDEADEVRETTIRNQARDIVARGGAPEGTSPDTDDLDTLADTLEISVFVESIRLEG